MTDSGTSGTLFSGMEPHELLQFVYDEFKANNEWPVAADVEATLRKRCHARSLAAELLGLMVFGNGPNDKCFLQIEGLLECRGSETDLANFAQAARFVARDFIRTRGEPIRIGALFDDLRLPTSEAERLRKILERIHDLWSAGPSDWSDADSTFKPSRETLYYEGVSDIHQFLEKREEIRRMNSKAAGHQVGHRGQRILPSVVGPLGRTLRELRGVEALAIELPFRDPRLEAVFQKDLLELGAVFDAGALKAAAILAGSCLEAVLLDFLQTSAEGVSETNDRGGSRRLGIGELLRNAAEKGTLPRTHANLAEAIQHARNLVHPERAVEEGDVSEPLVSVLVSTLDLICHEVRRARDPRFAEEKRVDQE